MDTCLIVPTTSVPHWHLSILIGSLIGVVENGLLSFIIIAISLGLNGRRMLYVCHNCHRVGGSQLIGLRLNGSV